MDQIYLDNSATTPMLPEVSEAMRPYYFERAGNPASSHGAGRQARKALEDAREQIALLLDAAPDEVIFTSGATEANNLALFGLSGDPPGLLVTSAVEHPSVLEPAKALEMRGFSFAPMPVSSEGIIEVPSEWPPPELRLVSVQLANHETGAIQPVSDLVARTLTPPGPPLPRGGGNPAPPLDAEVPPPLGKGGPGGVVIHCDAAAAAGKMPISFRQLGVSALTISAHKFHGPKGIGALLVRTRDKLHPLLWGGHQQLGKRPGTEPVALAVGMAAALDYCSTHMEDHRTKVLQLRRLFVDRLRAGAAPAVVNGSEDARMPHIMNVSLPGCQADLLLMRLDLAGVCCSTGSACSSGSLLPSPVLQAMQAPPEVLRSAMRFSLSHLLTPADIDSAVERIIHIVNDLRKHQPI